MSFLNFALLPGIMLAAGIPLLIHLLNLKYPRLLDFSSVKRLRESVAQRSRVFRWRHWLLLLLRTLLLTLLLLAFLRPLLPRFGSSKAPHGGRAVALIIDHSLSMEYQAGGIGCRKRAETEAEKILATLGTDDLVNVIVAGQTAKACFFELSPKLDEARHFVTGIGPGLGRADFSQANALAAGMFKGRRSPEIYYLSDFQRRSWSNVDFTALPPQARTFFVDCAPPDRGNRAILGAAISQAQVIAGDTVTLEVEVGNFRDQPMDEPVKVVLDGRTSFDKEVTAPPWSTAKITLPIPPGGPGLHQCEIKIAPDELPQDDQFFLTIPVLEKEGILIVSDSAEPDRDAVHFLEAALNPYEGQAGSLRPEHIRTAEMTNARLALVKKVFFTRAGPLSDAAAKLVADFIFHGGGVVYFLDGDHDPANLAAIEKGMGSSRMPLKLGGRRVAGNLAVGAQQIIRGDFKSRYLRLFRGELRQNLALLEFYDLYDAVGAGTGNILLTYADETPAMAALNHGLGTLLLMNFSVSEFSSNLARQRIFPAWMQEIVKNLDSEEAVASSTIVGDAVNDEVWKREVQGAGLRKPSGEPADARVEPMGERAGLSFVPEELGFYTIREGKLLHSYAVNPPSEESDLRPIDRTLLPERVGEHGLDGYFVQGREDFADLVQGKPIFHWFILAAVAMLLGEMALQFFVQSSQVRRK